MMNTNDTEKLRAALYGIMLHTNYDRKDKYLSSTEILELSNKILLLPHDYQSILYAKYVFMLSPNKVSYLFEIQHPKEELKYIESILAYALKLPKDYKIEESCMKQATELAIQKYTSKYNIDNMAIPIYSSNFNKDLNKIGIKIKNNRVSKFKVSMIILIASILIFAFALTVSANLREFINNWIINTFPQYSTFLYDRDDTEEGIIIPNIELGYIPEDYEITDKYKSEQILTYKLKNANNQIIFLTAKESGTSINAFNTEDAEIHKIILFDQTAYWWEKNRIFVVWYNQNMEFSITGQCELKELLKIIENLIF